VKDLVRLWINRTVLPELLAVEADHLLVNRELILGDGRYRLYVGLMNPVMDSDVTPIDPILFEMPTYLTE